MQSSLFTPHLNSCDHLALGAVVTSWLEASITAWLQVSSLVSRRILLTELPHDDRVVKGVRFNKSLREISSKSEVECYRFRFRQVRNHIN